MSFGLQDVLATGAAIAALAVIVQKVVGTIRPSHPPACANCPLVTEPRGDSGTRVSRVKRVTRVKSEAGEW